jgi:transcription elongation factor GreA-like protein
MGRRKKAEPDDKEQSGRFLKTAKNIQTDDGKEKFEIACSKIFKTRRKNKT